LKKGGESEYKESMDNMMITRKELATHRKEFKTTRWLEIKEMEERRVAVEEAAKRLEQEERIMFMDPKQREEPTLSLCVIKSWQQDPWEGSPWAASWVD
ncbi:hypothetical protein BAE44_0026340, partial [Dichanthelium oligosanthes]